MDHSQILLKSHSAHGCRHEHVAAGFQVLAIAIRLGKRFKDQPNPLESNAIAHRVERRTGEAFDAVRQRIGPGRSGQVRRQAHRQRGI